MRSLPRSCHSCLTARANSFQWESVVSTRFHSEAVMSCTQWFGTYEFFSEGLSEGLSESPVIQPQRQRGELRAGRIERHLNRRSPSTRRRPLSILRWSADERSIAGAQQGAPQ